MAAEQSASDEKEKKVRKRKKGVYKKMAAQLEFYFSDANLRKSKFLRELIEKDPWVPLAVFDKFNRIKELLSELGDDNVEKHILKALQVGSSTFFQISEDQKKLRRVAELAEKEDVEECTVYVENLPKDTTHESLTTKFKEFGPVTYVSLPKYRNSSRIKGFAFVEFDSKETVRKVLDSYVTSSEVTPDSLQSVQTYREEHEEGGQGKENETNSSQKRKHEEDEDDDEAPKRLRIDENVQSEQKKEPEDAVVDGLRVLTKTQWRRLRNRYLNEQRKNMSAAKAMLRMRKSVTDSSTAAVKPVRKPLDTAGGGGESISGSSSSSVQTIAEGGGGGGGSGESQLTAADSGRAARAFRSQAGSKKGDSQPAFTPGLIVRFSVESGVDDPKAVRKTIRELADVAYVDARIGQTQFYVRCRDVSQAKDLAAAAPDTWNGCTIKDEEEAAYWRRIEEDKEEKRSGRVVVPKTKSKRRLLAKLETAKSSHVYFDD